MQCAAQQQQKLIWGVNGEQLEHKTTSFVLCGCCEAWKDEEQVELFFFCILDVSLPSSCSLYTCFAFQSCFFKVLRRRSALEAPRIMFCHLLPSSFFNDPARKQKKLFRFAMGTNTAGKAARKCRWTEKKKERQRLKDERSQRKFLLLLEMGARSPRERAGLHFSRVESLMLLIRVQVAEAAVEERPSRPKKNTAKVDLENWWMEIESIDNFFSCDLRLCGRRFVVPFVYSIRWVIVCSF